MSNNLRTRNGMPFNFVNGLKVRGMDIESLIPGIEGIPEAGSKYQFAGDGANKSFTLPVSPYNKDAVDVYVKQLYVHPDDYTLVGDTVTLVEAPPAVVAGETYNVVIKVSLTTLNGYVNANRVSFEGENLDDILEKGKPLANYSNLRAYAGAATQVRITDPGIAGFFYYDANDTTSADNGGTVIVGADGWRWKRVFDGAASVKWFGAVGNGIADDGPAIQMALNSGTKAVLLPAGTFKLSAPLDIPSGVRFVGEGRESVLTMTGSATPTIISLNAKIGVSVEAMRLIPQSTGGATRAGVYLNLCQNVTVRDCSVYGQTDATGVWLMDSDYCLVDNLYFDGGEGMSAYTVYMAGCKGCKAINSTAFRPQFGFVIVGKDIQPASTRTTEETFGNIISNCVVRNHSGHAYDINSATGNIISNCSAEDYAGASTNIAFQVKHPSGDSARQNVITGCTARNVPSGFGAQEGSNVVFIGCTATNVAKNGFALNSTNRSQFIGCTVREFGEYGIWISSTSARNIFSGIVLETSATTATGIGLLASGSSGNEFDNIQMIGTLAYAIDIVSGANNNKFGKNVDVNQQAIRDASGNTYWPIVITTPEISAAVAGNVNGPYVHRGMVVAVARAVVTVAITGTPQVSFGRVGANSEIAALQNVTGGAGATVVLTQQSQMLSNAAIMQARINVAGSAGTMFFQYEGLPRL